MSPIPPGRDRFDVQDGALEASTSCARLEEVPPRENASHASLIHEGRAHADTVAVRQPGGSLPRALRLLCLAAAMIAPAEMVEPVCNARTFDPGDADPHGMGCGDDVASDWRRPMTFSALSHQEAAPDELMARPFAWMNEPSPSQPSAPPPAPEQPPTFTRLDEIIPVDTIKVVRRWQRRLRRCLALAARGDLSAARRMRPPDLWIPEAQALTVAARAWDWDLRPLDCGLPAEAWQPSGDAETEAEPSGLNSGLRPAALRAALQEAMHDPVGFADCGIISEMLHGIRDDTTLPRGSLLCAPHTSALKFWEVASERTSRNVTKGWAFEGPLPCWPLRACPYGVVDESERAGEPKWRLTQDLSWPHPGMLPAGGGEFVQSHNASMDRSGWPPTRMLRVREFAEAAAVMQLSGAPVAMWSADCDSFYRVMGRQRAEIWRNVIATAKGMQVDERCCFGSAADAVKCVRVSNFLIHHARRAMQEVDTLYPPRDERILRWQQRRRAAAGGRVRGVEVASDDLHVCGAFIDDCAGASFNDLLFAADGSPVMRGGEQLSRATLHFEALKDTLERFGHLSKKAKEQSPRQSIDLLGVTINLELRTFAMQQDKRERYAGRVSAALELDRMSRKEYQRLVGRLQFAAQCFPIGRQWMHAAVQVGRAKFRLHADAVPITPAVKADLRRWLVELQRDDHPGVPLAACTALPAMGAPETGAIYADASGEIGWAAWTATGDELLVTGGVWTEAVRHGLIICEKELYASTAGLTTLAAPAAIRSCYSFTDSTVALSAMLSLTPSTPRMQELTAARLSWMLAHGVREQPARVTSKNNLWADFGSRGRWHALAEQADALGLTLRWVEPNAWPADELLAVREDGEHLRAHPALPARSPPAVAPSAAEANRAAIALANSDVIASMREAYVLASSRDRQANQSSATVKYWLYFTLLGRGVSAVRSVDASSSTADKLDEEQLLMDFAVWLMLTKPGGRSISWKTARKHVSTLQSWHRKQVGSGGSIGADLPLHRLKAMWDGMKRDGPEAVKRLRRGVRPQLLAKAMAAHLSTSEREDAMWRAALSTGFCALMRGGELGTQRGEDFDPTLHLTRADVTFFRKGGVLHARIRMRPLKKERMRKHKGVTLTLAAGGTILDPVAELWRMIELDPIEPGTEAATPLFRHSSGKRAGCAIATDDVCSMVKRLMAAVGQTPDAFGAHSLRIGGATAALAAGIDAAVIKVLGRWDSDVFEIYTRCTREATSTASMLIGSTSCHDTEGPILTEEFDELAAPGLPSFDETAVAVLGDSDDDAADDEDDADRDD